MRFHQSLLIGCTIVGSWLGMQAVHEAGHVLGAWLTSGHVTRVVLHPLTISRTDLEANPHPLVVVWAGPVVGVLLPLLIWGIAMAARTSFAFLFRFFSGFCCIANGAYIAGGSFSGVGDCGEMLRHGSPIWLLWLFGAGTVPVGLWGWHGQGVHFGLGPSQRPVNPKLAYLSFGVVVGWIILMFWFGGRF